MKIILVRQEWNDLSMSVYNALSTFADVGCAWISDVTFDRNGVVLEPLNFEHIVLFDSTEDLYDSHIAKILDSLDIPLTVIVENVVEDERRSDMYARAYNFIVMNEKDKAIMERYEKPVLTYPKDEGLEALEEFING